MACERLILGLGNPGAEYDGTRHNVGFEVVAELARRRAVELGGDECRTRLAAADEVWLGQPQTFMNRSGYAAVCLAERHGFEPENVLVVLDEIHLSLGRLRLRPAGSPGGHRGLESILEALRTDRVPRLRLGVGPLDSDVEGEDLVDFVLAPFAAEERDRVDTMVARAADACEMWLAQGVEVAMNQFNG